MEHRSRLEQERPGFCLDPDPTHPPAIPLPYKLLALGLKAAGLFPRGYRNFRAVGLTTLDHFLPRWPAALDGFRVLQLSDLHIDLDAALLEPVCRLLHGVACELAVFTGDFWEGGHGNQAEARQRMRSIMASLSRPAFGSFGVLGNHDTVAMADALEGLGVRVLVNEALTLETPEGPIVLGGVDDAYYFGLHDVPAAARHGPGKAPKLLLSHSPQIAPAAREAGFDFMFSGHTHGGQVCLPGGYSLAHMDEIPRALFRGRWQVGSLAGYTTTGTGACHVPVRYNCPPEVVLHVFHRAA